MPTARALKVALGLRKKETAFADGYADDTPFTDMLKMQEINFAEVETKYRTDEDELNGYNGPTEHEVESKNASLSRKMKAAVESIAAFVIWALGRVTTTGSGPYTHVVKMPTICTLNPPSFAFIEGLDCAGSTGTYFKYKGSVVESITIELQGKGAVILTINVKTDGSETAKASFTFPASFTAVNRLLGSMGTVKLGPDLAVSTANLSSNKLLRSLKITINCAIREPDNITNSVYVDEYQYGENKPDIQISLRMKGDKSSLHYGYYQSNTACKFQMLLQRSVSASVQLDMNQCVIKAKATHDGPEPVLDIDIMAEANSTDDGLAKWTFINGIATYLNAA